MRTSQLDLESHVGASITIPVQDIPGAGYLWSLTQLSDLVTLDSTNRPHVPTDDLPLGQQPVGGIRPKEFHFWARREGQAALTFELLRPFTPEEPAEVLTVQISIAAKPAAKSWAPEGWPAIGQAAS